MAFIVTIADENDSREEVYAHRAEALCAAYEALAEMNADDIVGVVKVRLEARNETIQVWSEVSNALRA